jgi:hypothetical protein
MVLPLGRNVTLYFFVAGVYLTSSMYGLLPPMVLSFGKIRNSTLGKDYILPSWGAAVLRPYKIVRATR